MHNTRINFFFEYLAVARLKPETPHNPLPPFC